MAPKNTSKAAPCNAFDSATHASAQPRCTGPVTRSMTLMKRTRFPFLQLPAELRNMVYEYLVNFDGVERLLTSYYASHFDGDPPAKWPVRDVHPLLLVNEQVSREAAYILHQTTLRIPHSMLPSGLITDFISEDLLANLRSVDITRDSSFGEKHMWCDLMDFFKLIKQAASIWSRSHHLQRLTVDMKSKQVATHLDRCPGEGPCYFLYELQETVSLLGELRGIKKVTFGGFLAQYATEAGRRMQLPPAKTLMTIPLCVRRRIYGYIVDINHVNDALVRASHAVVACGTSPTTTDVVGPCVSSPGILRVNRQMKREVLDAVYAHTLTLTAPPPHRVRACASLTKFVGTHVLQNIRHLALDIDSRGSAPVAADWCILVANLARCLRSSSTPKLATLHVSIRDAQWAKAQLKAGVPAFSVMPCMVSRHDVYGLSALCLITGVRLHRLSFGDGVHVDLQKRLRDSLCGPDGVTS